MSPRKNRRADAGPGPSSGDSSWTQRTEEGSDGDWNVRTVSGSSAAKPYRCPGCDQLIPPATPHVVVWPENPSLLAAIGGAQSLDERRHWHTACWQRRR